MPVTPDEILSRYLFSKNNFSLTKHSVHYTAFMPPPDRRLSVFRTSGLSEAENWAIGDAVGELRGKILFGRGDIKAAVINESRLSIDPNDIPPRHANIVDWPDDDSAIKLLAIELADRASFYQR